TWMWGMAARELPCSRESITRSELHTADGRPTACALTTDRRSVTLGSHAIPDLLRRQPRLIGARLSDGRRRGRLADLCAKPQCPAPGAGGPGAVPTVAQRRLGCRTCGGSLRRGADRGFLSAHCGRRGGIVVVGDFGGPGQGRRAVLCGCGVWSGDG